MREDSSHCCRALIPGDAPSIFFRDGSLEASTSTDYAEGLHLTSKLVSARPSLACLNTTHNGVRREDNAIHSGEESQHKISCKSSSFISPRNSHQTVNITQLIDNDPYGRPNSLTSLQPLTYTVTSNASWVMHDPRIGLLVRVCPQPALH